MIVNLIMLFIMYPIIWILYFCMRGNYAKNSSYIFGVTIVKGLMELQEIDEIYKEYKRKLFRIFIFFMIFPIVCFLTDYVSIQVFIWMCWLYAYIFINTIPFAKANEKVLECKNRLRSDETVSTTNYYELKGSDAGRRVHFKQFLLPMVLSVASIVLLAVTTLMGADGMDPMKLADARFISVVSIALVTPVLYLCAVLIDKQKVVVINSNSDININYSRAKKNVWKSFWLAAAWINSVCGIGIALAFSFLRYDVIAVIVISIIEGIATAILVGRAMLKLNSIENSYKDKIDNSFLADDDKYWIRGMVYSNPKDPHAMVASRTGMGTTMNMATGIGKGMNIFAIIAIVASLVFCAVMIVEELTPINVYCEEGYVYCENIGVKYKIDTESINAVEIINELPDNEKVSGVNYKNAYIGKFRMDGEICKVFLNPNNEKFIKITTGDVTYYLSGHTDSDTEILKQQLAK